MIRRLFVVKDLEESSVIKGLINVKNREVISEIKRLVGGEESRAELRD